MYLRFRATVAKDADILKISKGEVTSFRNHNFRFSTPQPSVGGLFCPKIFGPTSDYTCLCGVRHSPKVKECPTCGVPIIKASERAHRYGHVNLRVKIINPMAYNIVASIFNIGIKAMKSLAIGDLQFYLLPNENGSLYSKDGTRYSLMLEPVETVDEIEHHVSFESMYNLFKKYDIDGKLTMEMSPSEFAQSYYNIGYDLYDFFSQNILVNPPVYRDVSILNTTVNYHPSNQIYLRLVRIGGMVSHFEESQEEEFLELKDKQSLVAQNLLNRLFFTGATDSHGKEIPSIISKFTDKDGLIRGNLLGKRVDYSARSVIVSGPELDIDCVGLPFKIAYELLRPKIIGILERRYADRGNKSPIKSAVRAYKKKSEEAKEICEDIAPENYVMLNRAPSLHRYSVMSFKIKLHYKHYISMPPLACNPFNADFDGDTMAVHLSLSNESREEAKTILSPGENIMSSISFENPNFAPSHEMTVGLYQMTL